ncbi:hypothetical protein KIPB_012831, partial [Kipferlia bialata]|eukprot:g12831.t1
MLAAYASLPMVLYPLGCLVNTYIGGNRIALMLVLLSVFYGFEFMFGTLTRLIGVTAWDY